MSGALIRLVLLLPLSLGLAVMAPAPAAAQESAPGAVRTDPGLADRAMTLARILNSEAIILGDAESDEEALALVPQLFGSNETLAGLERDYPGISLETARAVLPIINRSARQRLPQLQERQAALYAASFTAPELDTLIAFYQSPTGAKLIVAMMDAIHPKHMMAEAQKSPEMRFGAESVLADIRDATPKVASTLTDADNEALARLATGGLLAKIKRFAPQTQKIAIDWMSESAPGEDAEMEKVITAIIKRRMAKR